MTESDLTLDDAVRLFSVFCAIHHQPFDRNLFAQRFPAPIALSALHLASEELGLTCEHRRCSLGSALAWSVPLAVKLRTQEAAESWAIVLSASETQVSVLESETSPPRLLEIEELRASYAGAALLLRPKIAQGIDPDALDLRRARFGLRWFVPELLKHRAIWREVLLASLVLQLVALAVPLFTQVIIDKVIVHRTESTLIALVVGLALFLVFTGVLTWTRQYLVLHTGQRVDAVLGWHGFKAPRPFANSSRRQPSRWPSTCTVSSKARSPQSVRTYPKRRP